ncbi:hypothetical protein CDD82_470 [Ophiocordyceps australis]|uniref:Uncharacterized protein n=1 Tax=Ophiocordyceps australis TaxID=1399860 RepID=A0A2C5YLI3_9HYPO|nr:hypothetical protein CDD82_470 [Ophiocordyceps australis]
MHNNRSHPLLEQVPLTVSPFVSLPTATTLSYNYKTMPSSIPPSSKLSLKHIMNDEDPDAFSPPYNVSSPSHPSTPSNASLSVNLSSPSNASSSSPASAPVYSAPQVLIRTCRELVDYLVEVEKRGREDIAAFDQQRREERLMERRRIAPGWLDRAERILEPERVATNQEQQPPTASAAAAPQAAPSEPPTLQLDAAGEQLDKAFGDLSL